MTVTEPTDERSLGELVKDATQGLSALISQEIALAKLEIKKDVTAAAKGGGLFGAAGVAGIFAVLFLSAAAAWGLAEWLSPWAGFLIVGGVYLLVAALAALIGIKAVKQVGPPTQTISTVKADLAWVRHPTRSS
jgi:hypothetical protein